MPCYNECFEIESAIEGLEKQTYTDREIIIVDDGSTDSTVETASRLVEQRGYKDIQIVPSVHAGVSNARNIGAKDSKGDILFFAECDCLYSPEFTARAVARLEAEPMAAAISLTGSPLVTRSTIATECISIENKVQHKLLEQGRMIPFYAWVIRKAVFLEVGGYDRALSQAEDKDFFRRLTSRGYTVAWLPGEHWWHKRDQTVSEVAAKRVKRAQSRVSYLLKHRLFGEVVKGLVPFWLLFIGALLLPFYLLVGGLIVSLVLLAFVANSLRFALLAWDVAPKKRYLLGYPILQMARSFSTAIGSSIGLAKYFFSSTK